MDELTLYAELKPAPVTGYEAGRVRVRHRLESELAGIRPAGVTGSRAATPLRRRIMLTAAVVAVACAAVVTPALLPGGANVPMATSAWAVTRNGDGTVTLAFRYVADLPGLQRALAAAGVPAIVRSLEYHQYTLSGVPIDGPVCVYRPTAEELESARVQAAVIHRIPTSVRDLNRLLNRGHYFGIVDPEDLVIRPSAMPAGSVLFLSAVDDPGREVRSHPIAGDGIVGWAPPTVLRHDRVPACVPPPLGR